MTPTELRSTLQTLNWSLDRAARILHVDLSSVKRWASEKEWGRNPHPCAVLLLHAAVRFPVVRRWLEAQEPRCPNHGTEIRHKALDKPDR